MGIFYVTSFKLRLNIGISRFHLTAPFSINMPVSKLTLPEITCHFLYPNIINMQNLALIVDAKHISYQNFQHCYLFRWLHKGEKWLLKRNNFNSLSISSQLEIVLLF